MTCEIKYIEDLTTESREEKDRLSKLHIDISRQLYSHRFGHKGYTNQIFTFANDKLYVPGSGVYYKEATRLTKLINESVGFEAVKLVNDNINTARHYVSVDVRPDSIGAPVNVDTLQPFFKNYFGDSDIVNMSEEFEDYVPQHSEKFNELADSIRKKASIYLKGLSESRDYFKSNKTKKDLNVLLAMLNDRTTLGLIESVSKYVAISSYNLNNIKQRLSIINHKIKNLSTDVDVRKEQLEEISSFVRHSSYYYHLFDILEDFATKLGEVGATESRPIDNYERDLLEQDLKKFMEAEEIPEDKILGFLNQVPALLANSGELAVNFKTLYKSILPDSVAFSYEKSEQLENDIKAILTKNLKKDGGIHQQLLNLINDLRPFKSNLKDLHYETLTEIYYPVFERTFDNIDDRMSIDGKEKLDTKWKLTKKQFKALFAIGEEDISNHARWGSAMINVNEQVMATIANHFKEVMIDIDITNKEDIGALHEFLSDFNKRVEDLTENDINYVHDNSTIDAINEVDDSYVPTGEDEDVIEMMAFGRMRKYVARKTRNYLNAFNNIKYGNEKKIFQHHLDDVVDEYAAVLSDNTYGLLELENTSDPTLKNFFNLLYYTDSDSGEILISNSMGKFLNSSPTSDELKGKLKGMLYNSFYKDRIVNKSQLEINTQLEENGVFDGDNPADLNDDRNVLVRNHVLNNVHWDTYREYQKGEFEASSLKDRFYWNANSLFGKFNGNTKQVLVRFTDMSYGYVELINTSQGVIVTNTSGKEISKFGTFSKDYNSLAANYHIMNGGFSAESKRKWEWKESNEFNKKYFDKVINLYKSSNNNFGPIHLKNREIPQVSKMENASNLAKAKVLKDRISRGEAATMFYDEMDSYLFKESKVPTDEVTTYTNEDGEEVTVPVYTTTERQYVNGQKIRDVSARFIAPMPLKNLENSIYKSILMYKTSSNTFRGLKDNESQALLLQTILQGDKTLGIDPRKVKVKKHGVDMKVPGGELKYKETDLNSTKLMISFINDYVFNSEQEDFGVAGLSAKKIASVLSGYTAYAALAWNLTTMPSNRIISLLNSRSVAKGNQFFNEQHWKDAVLIYNTSYGKFFSDFKNPGFLNKKSQLTQLLVRFNGMQGEFLSPQGAIESKDLADKMSDSALFWTQELVEHANQTESMIMLMKGYILPSGRSLWDAIEQENVDRKDGEAIKIPTEYNGQPEFTREKEIEFQKRLQGVNRQIHGNYSKLDKNDMQRKIFSNMLMTFRRYIYDGFRSRFMEERWDQEMKDEQEGYFRTYLKALNKDFTQVAKTQGLLAALRSDGLKTIGTSLVKTSLGGWDAATFRLLSKSSPKIKEFLYGENPTDRQAYAAIRATYEIGNVIRAMLLVMLVEALMSGLDEDDEELKGMLSYIDIYARKVESDIGLFTSFTNFATGGIAGPTLDQTWRLVRNPFAATRSIDNTSAIFMQLTDFDAMNDEGEFDPSWGALDKYEKSGNGYEKGDYKIGRKIEKSSFSPYYQVVRIADYDQQLSYMSMIFKSSN